MKKILVGMSGGVDSSAAALILKNQGYDVCGCTLRLLPDGGNDADIKSAEDVCRRLGIEHTVIDLAEEFRRYVKDSFADTYISGGTPNPCVLCNRRIKFGAMLDKALEMGFDGIATGHYAGIIRSEKDGRFLLVRPEDKFKDQTYMLCMLTQFQLEHSLFPLCGYDKQAVRKLAEENGLACADRPDSQDICFVPDGDYVSFIERHTGRVFPQGDYIDESGRVIGRHEGYIRYTVGQRKGLGAAFGEPMYVCGKNPAANTVTLKGGGVYSDAVTAADVNFISIPESDGEMRVTAKVRYNMQPAAGVLTPLGGGRIKVAFDSPVSAPAKGQSLVVYDGDTVVCGGTIE